MAAQFALKAALRKSMNKTLRALSEEQLAEQCVSPSALSCVRHSQRIPLMTVALAVTRQLVLQPFFKKARNVGCYLSMGKGELRTGGIVEECLKTGALLAPRRAGSRVGVKTDQQIQSYTYHTYHQQQRQPPQPETLIRLRWTCCVCTVWRICTRVRWTSGVYWIRGWT